MSSNTQLYQTVLVPAIVSLPSGYEFRIRDLAPNPPALAGRMVFKHQAALGIEKIPNHVDNVNLWRKK